MSALTLGPRAGSGVGARARPDGRPCPGATAGRRARRFWAWLTQTGYRPERHYMRGGLRDQHHATRPDLT